VDEDLQDPEVGRDELGDEPLVAVGGVTERIATGGALVERQVEGLIDPVGPTASVGRMAGLAARTAALRSGFSGSRRSVELLGGGCGDIERGEMALESVDLLLPLGEFPVLLLELLAELSDLRLQLFGALETTKELEPFLLGERDGALLVGGEENVGVPSSHDALG
jgi:hypothetical protein